MTADELDALLVFATTYRVMRADRILQSEGILHGLVPTPSLVRGSCGLALRLHSADVDRALQTLVDAGVAADGIYTQTAAGWTRRDAS